MKPALMFAMYVMFFHIDVVGTVHLTHNENTRMDMVSRRIVWEEVWKEDQRFYGGTLPRNPRFLDLQLEGVMTFLDPRSLIDDDVQFTTFFKSCLAYCESIRLRQANSIRPI